MELWGINVKITEEILIVTFLVNDKTKFHDLNKTYFLKGKKKSIKVLNNGNLSEKSFQ